MRLSRFFWTSVRLYWEYSGADVDRAHEIYHDDAVLEFPPSGRAIQRRRHVHRMAEAVSGRRALPGAKDHYT